MKKKPFFVPDSFCRPPFVAVLLDPNNSGENEMALIAMVPMNGIKIVSKKKSIL